LFFVLIGFVLTTIIQSSSATIAITLTAIYVGALTLPAAAAVVIGSEVGTTIKILLWGMTGSADKKRVAWGNFIYNIFTSVVAFLGLDWVLYFIKHIAGVTDPLVSLVFFQSSVNIISIILFVPFLTGFSNWLEKTFRSHDVFERKHKSELLPLLVIEQMCKEVLLLLNQVRYFNCQMLFMYLFCQGYQGR
jgi:phosphate:Na+ symporter